MIAELRHRVTHQQATASDDGVGGQTTAWATVLPLWANVQTLQPAIYIKPPQPVVERRYLDKDPMARNSAIVFQV